MVTNTVKIVRLILESWDTYDKQMYFVYDPKFYIIFWSS